MSSVKRASLSSWGLLFLAVHVFWAVTVFPVLAQDTSKTPLVVMGDKNFPPYESLVDGKPSGINVDLWREIAKILGRPLDLRLYQWADSQARVQRGEAKVLTFMSFNKERAKLYDFTKPTFTARFPVFVLAEIAANFVDSDLTGKRIAVKRGGIPRNIIETIHPEAVIVLMDSALEGFRKLLRGEVDGVIEEERVGFTILRENELYGIRAIPKALAVKTSHIAVAKGNPALLRQIDEALEAIKASGKFDQIADKWASLDTVLIKRETIRFVIVSALVVIFLFVSFGGVVYVLKVRRANLALQEEITERKRAEENTKRMAAAIDGLSENFALYGPDDRLVMCNQGYSNLNEAIPEATRPGVSYEEHMRAVVAKGLAPKALGREEDYIRERMERHRNPTGPYEVIRKDRVWLVHEQRGADGYTATIATDITERKRTEEALVASEEKHRHFSADVAHELRTPLAVLRSHLDNLENTETIQSLIKDVDAMSRLVSQLLATTRLDSLTVNPNDEADLHSIGAEVAKYLAPFAIKEGRSIEATGTQYPVIVQGNGDALEMAVRNLVENAIRYSARKTVVTINVSDEPAISVIDRGRGIPPEQKKVIFRRFQRADRRSGGAGLGLSIVQRVVEAHQATIDVSDAPGGGTVFKISFPSYKSLKVAAS